MTKIKFTKELLERSVLTVYPDATHFVWDSDGSVNFETNSGNAIVAPRSLSELKDEIDHLRISVAYYQGAADQSHKMFKTTLSSMWDDQLDDDDIIPGVDDE